MEIPFAIFGCGGHHTIKENELKEMEELEKEMGSHYWIPTCQECHVELGIGDQLDGFHPYHQEYNYCKHCKDHMKKPDKEKITEEEYKRFAAAYEDKVIVLNPREEWSNE